MMGNIVYSQSQSARIQHLVYYTAAEKLAPGNDDSTEL